MPGFLYQTEDERKSARQKERECQRQSIAGRGTASAIKQTVRENMRCECEINWQCDQDVANDVVP